MNKFRFLLLTKSYKDNGYCVAGLNLDENKFVRLMLENNPKSSIPYYYMAAYECLDILEINPIRHIPFGCQTENVLMRFSPSPQKIGHATLYQLFGYLSPSTKIFDNTDKRVLPSEITKLDQSLGLYFVENLSIHCYINEDHPSYKCTFKYYGNWYRNISLTDPAYREPHFDEVVLEKAIIVVSLPALPFVDDCYYKFVAKIFKLGD